MKNTALLDTSGIVFMGVYLVSLLLVGVAGRFVFCTATLKKKTKDNFY